MKSAPGRPVVSVSAAVEEVCSWASLAFSAETSAAVPAAARLRNPRRPTECSLRFDMVLIGGSSSTLEYELQSELDLPGTCCGCRQNTRTRGELASQIKDLPGSRAGRLEVRVIGYVETLRPELQVFLLGDRETLHDREIHRGDTRS